jgi:hypothetical protein
VHVSRFSYKACDCCTPYDSGFDSEPLMHMHFVTVGLPRDSQLYKRLQWPSSPACLKTPNCAPSTEIGSPSPLRTCGLQSGSEGLGHDDSDFSIDASLQSESEGLGHADVDFFVDDCAEDRRRVHKPSLPLMMQLQVLRLLLQVQN